MLNPQTLAFGRKAQALERNGKLRDPALARARRSNVPDRIPLGVQVTVGKHQSVDERARRIGRKVEGTALIAERVEEDLDAIVGVEAAVARHLRADDALRLGVVGGIPM